MKIDVAKLARTLVAAQGSKVHPYEEAKILQAAIERPVKSGRQHSLVPLHERLINRVVFGSNDCWNWMGPVNKQGYGRITYEGRMQMVHRLSYIAFTGKPLAEWPTLILHSCDNPSCINPEHLSVGTHKDNYHDAASKNRRVYRGRKTSGGEI